LRVSRNPTVLWRRTSTSVVVLPPGGDPLELVGPAAAIWDNVPDRPDTRGTGDSEVASPMTPAIVAELLDLGLVLQS
jgi:hypothetical protein